MGWDADEGRRTRKELNPILGAKSLRIDAKSETGMDSCTNRRYWRSRLGENYVNLDLLDPITDIGCPIAIFCQNTVPNTILVIEFVHIPSVFDNSPK